MARRLASLALALALAGCTASPGAELATTAPATPTPPAPTDVPTPPPATPTIPTGVTPASSDVVLRALAIPDVTGPWPPVPITVYADGSVVIPSVVALRAPGVRRLSPAGLDRLRERVRSSGLFETSRTLPPLRPPESGFVTYTIEFRDAGRAVTVSSSNVFPSEEGRQLIELADAILMTHPSVEPGDPVDPIEPADWVDGTAAPLPYRAAQTRLTVEAVAFPAGSWSRPVVDVGDVAWPLPGRPLDVGEPLVVAGDPARMIRCAIVTGDVEARLRAALDAARLDSVESGVLTRSWDLSAPTVPGILRLSLRPFLPDESPACDPAEVPDAPEPQPPAGPGFAEAWAAARLDSSKQPSLLMVLVEVYPNVEVPLRAVPAANVRWPGPVALGEPSCDVASFAEADAVVRALEAAGARETGGSPDGEYDLAGAVPDTIVRVSVGVVGPDVIDPCGTIGF